VTGGARGTYARIYAVVRRIPSGKVTTYGNVARIAGLPGHARQVGYALAALPDGTSVPWHRVINAQGRLSLERVSSSSGTTQRIRLAREGVTVNAGGRVSLARFGWRLSRAK
jgi:methylated-DNA-protein-cysteine methyltransferase related protein